MNFAGHVKIRNEKFGTVIFDTLTEKIFITDRIGAEILQLIEQDKDMDAIVDTLGSNYDGGRQSIETDVLDFINVVPRPFANYTCPII